MCFKRSYVKMFKALNAHAKWAFLYTENTMRKTYIFTVIFAFILGLVVASFYWIHHSAPKILQGEALVKKVLESTPNVKGKLIIQKHFLVNKSILGFVLADKATPEQPLGILYTDRSGTYLINPATTINADKQTLYAYGFAHYIESSAAKAALKNIQATHYVTQGKDNAPHKIWIVVDPNCIFCHKTFEAMQPLVQAGDVQIRWVILGFLKPSSADKAKAILGAQDPLKALEENEAKFDSKQEEGGIQPLKTISSKVTALFEDNMKFAQQLTTLATPTFIFKSNDIARMKQGYPGSESKLKALVQTASSQF